MAAMALSVSLLAGCSSENITETGNKNSEDNIEGKVVFASEAPETRTAGVYDNTKMDFSWTLNDKIWINDSPRLVDSKRSNITGTQASAKFYFDEPFTNPSYKVRYTGVNATSGDKVTIAANQTQATPNDASHIGTDGDCGFATATLTGDVYKFKLDHKASYITFVPWYGKEQLSNDVYVKSIKVTADENIAGIYDFDDQTGIKTTGSVASASKTITLTLNDSYIIPKVADYTKNAATMVAAPGTYHNVKIEYTIHDKKTGVEGTITQKYASIDLKPGKNLPFKKSELKMENYKPNYYTWDAKKPCWYNNAPSTLPVISNESAPYTLDANNNWNDGDVLDGTNICADAINVNEAALYAWAGDAHWDGKTLWVMNGHVYQGGMWFLKLQYLGKGYTSPVQGINEWRNFNYRQNEYWKVWNETTASIDGAPWTASVGKMDKPTINPDHYFYLPAMGYVNNSGVLQLKDSGYFGAYWTQNAITLTNGSRQSIVLHFSDTKVGVNIDTRLYAYPVFTGSTLKQK